MTKDAEIIIEALLVAQQHGTDTARVIAQLETATAPQPPAAALQKLLGPQDLYGDFGKRVTAALLTWDNQ